MRRTVPLLITFAVGTVLAASYFLPRIESWGEDASIWFDILASIAFVLGGGNLLKLHGERVYRQRRGWGYSAVAVVAFLVTLSIGLAKVGVKPHRDYPDKSWLTGTYNEPGSALRYVYDYAFQPLMATTFAMLAFYVASAAFRAFRAKNIDAILLLGTAFLILLGRTFLGTTLTGALPERLSFMHVPVLTDWIMIVINAAGNRAIMIGIALGIASTSLKVILGIDRSYMGSEGA